MLSERYKVHEELLDLSQFGVPQLRTRYFLLALQPGLYAENPFDLLKGRLPTYLRSLGLRAPVSSWAAISDLEISRGGRRESTETDGFDEIKYAGPRTQFQKLMRDGAKEPSDLRLARHCSKITTRFEEIIELSHAEGRLNTTISEEVRTRYGLKKRALRGRRSPACRMGPSFGLRCRITDSRSAARHRRRKLSLGDEGSK
jgi:DNA (cytosine-5)-methyltransferase 1